MSDRGERGPRGDHGQTGDTGLTGPRGAPYSSWLTRNILAGYLILLGGVILTFAFTAHVNAEDRRRDRAQAARDRAEQVETDRAFCTIINDNRSRDNRILASLRESFNLVRPAPGTPPEAAKRTDEFRERILATLNGDAPLLDCSGIGDGKINFSLQDAIRNHTTTTTVP